MSNIKENPWAGLAAYQDPDISQFPLKFCGRDNETYDVTQLIDENLFVTLYGKSGVGKTSLLNAGVFPKLRSLGYLPISIRLGVEEDKLSFQECFLSKLCTIFEGKGGHIESFDVTPMPDNNQAQEYLWSYFARNHFVDSENRSVFPVFVFDQFEEVFKKRKAEAESLLRQLNYLMDDSHAIFDRVVDGRTYTYDFNYRFVLSLREDDLYSLEDSIDNNYLTAMKRCRYRLRSLSPEGAREAILKPGEGLFNEQEEEYIVNTIISTAQNNEDNSISTNVLSLICSQLYTECEHTGDHIISYQLVQKYIEGNPFEKYYYKATEGFSNKERSYIERHLVDSSGRRDSISESDFFLHVKDGKKLLEGPHKILQRISISSNSKDNRIELIHDSFCAPLAELKQKRFLRRRLRLFFISICITIISLGVTAFIIYQKRQVDKLNLSMLENNSRFVSEKASLLTDEGDSYTARLLSLAVLPPNRPYVIEAEAALRKASYHNSAVLKGHMDKILSVCFSNDGERIISTTADSTIVWDALDGKRLKTSASQQASSNISFYGMNGMLKADVINMTDIVITDVRGGNDMILKGHTGRVNMVMFSPDGRVLASASDDNTIKIWDLATGMENKTLIGHSNYVTCLSFSPDGNRLVSGSLDKTVRIWDVYGNNAERIRLEKGYGMMKQCFSQDGALIASASFVDSVMIWNTRSGKRQSSFFVDNSINIKTLSFHPRNKQILVTAVGREIKIWNIKNGELFDTLSDHDSLIHCITFSQDGKYMASASVDKTIMVWDAYSYKHLKTLYGHKEIVNNVSFSNDGKSIASASTDKTIKIWDVKTGECLKTLIGHHDEVKFVSYSPNDSLLASASEGNSIIIWNIETQQSIKTFKSHNDKIVYVSFLSNDNLISASEDGQIKVWDVSSGNVLCDLDGYGTNHNILTAVFTSSLCNQIYSVFSDGVSERWNFPPLKKLIHETEERFKNVKFSSEQKRTYYIE